jgi:hypothetical protein
MNNLIHIDIHLPLLKNVPQKDPMKLNRYEKYIYNIITQNDGIGVRELQRIVCESKNPESMGHPTFLKYLKRLEEEKLIHHQKLKNKKIYYAEESWMGMNYETVEEYFEYEFEEISNIIAINLLGIEFLIRDPKKQFDVIHNSLLQLFGYQNSIKILRGVRHPEGDENNAKNEFVRKLQDLEDSVYLRTSIFMSEPLLSQYDKIIDTSYLKLLKLGLWKWTEIEKSSKRGDEQSMTIKRIYQEQFNENSTELIKRLKNKIKSLH